MSRLGQNGKTFQESWARPSTWPLHRCLMRSGFVLCFCVGDIARLKEVVREAQHLYDRMMSFWNGKGGQPTRPGAAVVMKAEARGL